MTRAQSVAREYQWRLFCQAWSGIAWMHVATVGASLLNCMRAWASLAEIDDEDDEEVMRDLLFTTENFLGSGARWPTVRR